MLSQVRGALKGVVAWFVIVLLILAFALWGVPELRTMTQSSALRVGDETFSPNYIQTRFSRQMEIRRQELGGEFTREQAMASGLPNQVVQSIATSSALKQAASDMGLITPRSIVRDYLQQNENFQNPVTGKFDSTVLQEILRNNALTVSGFEAEIADEILRNQLIGALVSSGPAPTPLADALLLRNTERRRVAHLLVTNEMAGVAAEPTPDDLQTYFENNPTAFTAPEFRTFQLVMLKEQAFRDGLETPEEELRRIYDLNKERLYEIPERRTIYQITVETESEAQAAAAALQQGKPFEAVAQENGLSLDAVTFTEIQKKDILDPSVSTAAFESGKGAGEISEPVKSLFGWTVVQVVDVLAPESKTFEDVRDEIESEYLNSDTRRKMLDTIDAIEEARDTGASLADAAADAGLEVKKFGPVDRYSFAPGGAIIDGIPGEVLSEVFRLDEGDESEAVDLAVENGYFFAALDEVTPPALIPYEDVAEEVEQRWRKDERAKRVSQAVRSIREAVEGGKTLEEAAAPLNRTPVVEIIERRTANDAISEALRDQIFFATIGDLVSGPAASGEAQVIAEIREVGFGRNAVSPQEVASFQQYLGFQLDQELLEAFVAQVREEYGVKVNQVQIDAMFADNQ